MASFVQFLTANRGTFDLNRLRIGHDLACTVATPRFETSDNLIFLVFDKHSNSPVLVGKISRFGQDASNALREAENLAALETAGIDVSAPRLVAIGQFCGNALLLETGVGGTMMSPSVVRSNRERCVRRVLRWLVQLALATRKQSTDCALWFDREIQPCLTTLQASIACSRSEVHVIESAANALRSRNNLSLVMEHGDCGHPNILVNRVGFVSVVDWESALRCGIAAADLFFFLSFVASAMDGAQTVAQHLRAFERTFFRRNSWARKHIKTYVEQTDFDSGLLLPVFVLTWCRYLSARLARVRARCAGAEPTMEQIQSDRYYAFMRYTLENVRDLAWMQFLEGE